MLDSPFDFAGFAKLYGSLRNVNRPQLLQQLAITAYAEHTGDR